MAIPTPGRPVRGSRSGAPIMALFDLLGRRWGMGILWRLSEGPCTFRELQTRCETISPTILNRRLKELREALLIERCADGYKLTDLGAELYGLLVPLGSYARTWAACLRAETDEA
ncbi:Helix-turn-helix transcriptional regulator [Sulfidibacter corallicola]|uniref:Helix-turn-helix transcriptional regulator n=1 Tax=Sulfidibacter corallicola TaxID=2818388 RepID=A0A8A4TJS8_SULCO|nr:helix-turn-helix domain-containing protein [Sulfidibacter corallicola]QTD49737.1 helix-turn-helix transcriptional regulator [Sulfidibacter corallicola]